MNNIGDRVCALLLQLTIMLLASSSAVFAQSGCQQASPESPSVVLGLLAGAGAGLPLLRALFKSRSGK
ncbi:MAG: PExPT-CTERM protein [Candidatus Binataceae bacterium]